MPVSNVHTLRRSSRVPIKVPVRVTSMEPNSQFSEICETLVVSAHGCALRFPLKLDTGSALRLHSRGGSQATAFVVSCQPIGPDGQGFRLGARLDRPDNFWGLESCPDDWRVVEMPVPASQQPPQKLAASSTVLHKPRTSPQASQAVFDKLEEQLSEDRLRGILATLVRPLQAEVTELREKLAVSAKRNRFEVSLGSIPPELEEKLWERLRQDVGTRVLQQTREQSAEMLGSAKTAIEQKISAALTEFRHRLAGEMHTVEQRTEVLSKELTNTAQQHVLAGLEKLQRQALEAGSHLNAQGEKVLCSLQEQLADSHDVHRREVEQIQADAAAKALQLQSEVSDLGQRVAALNESVRRLESDLDVHIERLASEIVAGAEAQIESAVALALKELQARGSTEVETRLNEMCSHMRTIQNRVEDSFSASLKTQGEEAVQSITQQFEELAPQSLEKWRLALAKDLNSVANVLGQQLRRELEPETGQSSIATTR
ncbi:MAG: PilZ domain-containing protein [Terriglobales bacterium]